MKGLRKVLWLTALATLFGSVSARTVRADEAAAEPVRSALGCCGACSPCCQSSGGAYFLTELLILRPYSTENHFGNQPIDNNAGYRLTAGYSTDGGLGARVRWLDFEDTRPRTRTARRDGVEVRYLDLEATLAPDIGEKFHVLLVGGVRFADYEDFENGNKNAPDTFFRRAAGPSVGIEVGYDIGQGLGVFGAYHVSFLFGDDRVNNNNNSMFGWQEIQVGLQYTRCFGGFKAFIRGGFEAHRFDGAAADDTQDAGLLGGFIGIGVTR